MRSAVSGVTSLYSLPSSRYHPSKRTCSDDALSDVPDICESTADMEDLAELELSMATLPNLQCGSPANVDRRQHPLAPFSEVRSTVSAESHASLSPVYSDIGGCSDVPS